MKRLFALAALLTSAFLFSPAAANAQVFTNATKLQGRRICIATPADTNVLVWSAANNCWGPGTSSGTGATIPSVTNLIKGNGSGNGADSGIAPANVVDLTSTQSLTNKTLDGVTSAVMAFLDATSSIQTQLNLKGQTTAVSTLPTAAAAVLYANYIWSGGTSANLCPASGAGGSGGSVTVTCRTDDNSAWYAVLTTDAAGNFTVGSTLPPGAQPNGVAIGGQTFAQRSPTSSRLISPNAYYASSVNTIGIVKNSLDTYGANEWACYYDQNSPAHVHITKIVLATGVITDTDTGKTADVSATGEHRACGLMLDVNGYIHLVFNNWVSALQYCISNNSQDPSAFTCPNSMLGTTVENSATYVYFFKNPTTGALYCTWVSNSSSITPAINQYFYAYNSTAKTWGAATGTSTNGLLISALNSPGTSSPYMNGLPKFNSSGSVVFSWTFWSGTTTTGRGEFLAIWNGTSFTHLSGATYTPPFLSTDTPDLSVSTTPQHDFAVDSAGVIYVPDTRQDSNNNWQMYVSESSSGSLVEHQLTFDNPVNLQGPVTGPYITVLAVGPSVYFTYQDNYSQERGIAAFQSSDHFATAHKFYVDHSWSPSWALNPDPTRLAAGLVTFLYEDTNDPGYGVSQLVTATTNGTINANLGSLSLLNWIPSIDAGFERGTPADLYGMNVVGSRSFSAQDSAGNSQMIMYVDGNGYPTIASLSGTKSLFLNSGGSSTVNRVMELGLGGVISSYTAPTNTVFNGNQNTGHANFSTADGLVALREDTSGCWNLDVYNSGSPFSAFRVCQNGAVTSVKTITTACTIASLPASPTSGQQCYFSDALTTADCTSGGGTAKSFCVYNGSAWAKP